MAESSDQATPSIVLEPKNLAARVVLPSGVDPQTLSVHLLSSLARERGIEMSPAAEAALAEVVSRYQLDGKAVSAIFINASLPEHGQPGCIEWMRGFNPDAPDEKEHNGTEERVDFYSHQSFVKVCKEDHVATIHPPTDGVDGRDVTGRTISANPGKPISVTLDSSLIQLADGRVLAQIDGLLTYDGKKLRVDPVLDIKGAVDFSTGNIDFDGDVIIRRDIRDKFRVKATGNVTIEGLIDASHIECQGSLNARRGVAGRGEGTLAVAGDAQIGYLDKVSGRIGGTLRFAREMMHSTISVGGDLVSDTGVIIGGTITVAGNARVADLGSASDTPTELRLSAPPNGDAPESSAASDAADLRARIAEMRKEIDSLQKAAGPSNPTAAERLTELTFEVSDAEARLRALSEKHPELAATVNTAKTCDSTLEVMRQIHGRVTLAIGSHTVHFADGVKGPVKIWLKGSSEVMCQFGEGAPKPIRTLGGVSDRAAA